jgi:hypothetical protein
MLTPGCAATSEVRPLTVYSVDWNARRVPLGKVAAVAEYHDEVTVFGSLGAFTFANGALVGTDPSVRAWRGAATIPATDGMGSWMVGLDARGRLYRVRARSTLEPISGRFGLEKTEVRTLSDLGRGRVAFSLGSSLAIIDGDRVARYDYPFVAIAGADGRGAGLTSEGARVFDPFRGVDRTFALEGLRSVAMADGGRVVVANEHAIWSEDDVGRLAIKYRSDDGSLRGLASSAESVWFADGHELGVLSSSGVARTTGLSASVTTILGSPSGDVWVIDNAGALQRYSTVRAAGVWHTVVAPIQTRVCSQCHGPDGSASLDLSSAARWNANRTAIERRVIKEQTMPPPGHPLSAEDRAAITRWLAAP